jgi:hypothetical protein
LDAKEKAEASARAREASTQSFYGRFGFSMIGLGHARARFGRLLQLGRDNTSVQTIQPSRPGIEMFSKCPQFYLIGACRTRARSAAQYSLMQTS